jgi:DNA-binding NarL/FixJ family response regulator
VVLADDHPAIRALLHHLLETEFEVVADVADGADLVTAVSLLKPDVIVTDIGMPGCDGLSATRAVMCEDPHARVVITTVDGDPDSVDRGLAAGALGYVLKHVAGDELIPAIHAALRGERHVSRAQE